MMPPEGGITQPSEILCDQLRSIDLRRISHRIGGPVTVTTMQTVEMILRNALEL
jgi:mRNA-degrading endonuclease toxin of MazEF toxin-antitoxin module